MARIKTRVFEKISANVEPGLPKKAKIKAAKMGISMSELINQALRAFVVGEKKIEKIS